MASVTDRAIPSPTAVVRSSAVASGAVGIENYERSRSPSKIPNLVFEFPMSTASSIKGEMVKSEKVKKLVWFQPILFHSFTFARLNFLALERQAVIDDVPAVSAAGSQTLSKPFDCGFSVVIDLESRTIFARVDTVDGGSGGGGFD